MAKRTIVETLSDLSGETGAATTQFGLDGVNYEIDLTPAERATLDQLLRRFVTNAQKLPGGPVGSRRLPYGEKVKADAGARETRRKVREWLSKSGYDVQIRGRIPAEMMAAYSAQMPHAAPAKPEQAAVVVEPEQPPVQAAEPRKTAPRKAVKARAVKAPETAPEGAVEPTRTVVPPAAKTRRAATTNTVVQMRPRKTAAAVTEQAPKTSRARKVASQ